MLLQRLCKRNNGKRGHGMIVQLTPEYKFVCDRCGKEQFPDQKEKFEIHDVRFEERSDGRILTSVGSVCHSCYLDFWQIASNFFDEVNKERSEK